MIAIIDDMWVGFIAIAKLSDSCTKELERRTSVCGLHKHFLNAEMEIARHRTQRELSW